MTYRSRGRSIIEVILAIAFTAFLVGFITVLCIGNYFRAKRAQDRQRQRRLAKLTDGNGGMIMVDEYGDTFSAGGGNHNTNNTPNSNSHPSGAGGGSSPGTPSGTYEAPQLVSA